MNRARKPLDDADKRILRVLQKDGRISISELSKKVGLSESPCQRRLKRLENDGWIAAYGCILDEEALGLGVSCFVLIQIHPHGDATSNQLRDLVVAIPEVVMCHAVSGEYDFLLKVVAEDNKSYAQIVNSRLLKLGNVIKIQTMFTLGVLKDGFVLPVD